MLLLQVFSIMISHIKVFVLKFWHFKLIDICVDWWFWWSNIFRSDKQFHVYKGLCESFEEVYSDQRVWIYIQRQQVRFITTKINKKSKKSSLIWIVILPKDIRYVQQHIVSLKIYIYEFFLLPDLVNMTALVPCIAVSTGFILLTCFLCEALRKIIESTVPDGLLKTALKEAVAGAELCGCGFELIISKSLRIVYCDLTIFLFIIHFC